MKLEMTLSEAKEIFKEIQEQPGQLFEIIRTDIRETVGQYLTPIMGNAPNAGGAWFAIMAR
jgi:putative transposase